MNSINPFWENNIEVDDNTTVNKEDSSIGVDFSFFSKDDAKKIDAGPAPDVKPKKKSNKLKLSVNGEVLPERTLDNPIPGAVVAETDYSRSYFETNNLIRRTISQADELSEDIKKDIDNVRNSKTIKSKYTYLTNLTSSASALISTKIQAIKELNSVITQTHNLELNRLKALKQDQTDTNDDMKMMDIYSAFVNTPIGSYTPNAPNIQDITLVANNNGINAIEMAANGKKEDLTPEQNRMRMEASTNVQTVVRYNQTTGQRCFDVIDKNTGASIPNYPRPDNFLIEDTTIDVHAGIARNRNINSVWPLIVEGSDAMIINEY